MKKLKPLAEKQITLTAGQLDLRTPSGRASEGYFRLLVNAIGDSRGRLKRMGGWRRLTLTPSSPDTTFAVVGDFGFADANQRAVASMITGWNPEFVVTTGDNIYGLTNTMTLQQANARFDAVIDAGYRSYYTAGTLYPVIGNHDTDYDPGSPAWFRGKFSGLFGNKNYYRKRKGPVEFFMLSSGLLTGGGLFEPDGNTVGSTQYQWLEAALADSTATFKVVVLHHPPYTSDQNYSPGETDLRWNFESLGADLVLSGHAHNYERRKDRDIPYVISGNGGATLRGYTGVDTEVSVVDDPPRFGALRCVVNDRSLRIQSITVDGETIDEFELCKGTNEDLHDQLQTNYDDGNVIAVPPTIPVTPPEVDVGVEAVVPAELPEIGVTWSEPCGYEMMVSWEPSNLPLEEMVGIQATASYGYPTPPDITSITFNHTSLAGNFGAFYNSVLTSISFPNLVSVGNLDYRNCSSLQTIDLPSLVTANGDGSLGSVLPPINIYGTGINIENNYALTNVNLPNFVPTNRISYRLSNNNLTQQCVEDFLGRLVAEASYVDGSVYVNGNNGLSATAVAHKDTLVARGVYIVF